MKKTLSFVFVAILLFGPLRSSLVEAAPSKDRSVISRISVRGTDVFDLETKTNLHKFPYTWINFLHIQTKEYIIRNELLFKVGDPMDVFLLRETERNLRALPFIRAARIVNFPQRDGTVALVIHVNDSWTTEPQFNASGTGGVDKVEIGFKEKNFLGLGKTVSYFHNKSEDVSENKLGYFDPQLLGTRWQVDAEDTEATNGSESTVKLARPFFASDVKWSAQSTYMHSQREVEEFSNNIKVSEFDLTKESSEVSGAIKVGKSRDTVHHAGLRYLRERTAFNPNERTQPGQILPDPTGRQTMFVDVERIENRFAEMTQLEKLSRIEDINLGATIRLSPGYSPTDLTGQSPTSQFQGRFEKYSQVKKENLFYSLFVYSSRDTFNDDAVNERFNFTMKYYHRQWKRQTIVVNNRLEWGQNLDPDNLIELGNENGLRAFKNVAFRGSKSWLFNLENRVFIMDDVWDLLSIGAVAFFDSGYVWEQGRTVALSQMRSDAGVGLRFALTRSSNEVVLRADFAYRMQRVNGDSPGWVFSFGSGQAF